MASSEPDVLDSRRTDSSHFPGVEPTRSGVGEVSRQSRVVRRVSHGGPLHPPDWLVRLSGGLCVALCLAVTPAAPGGRAFAGEDQYVARRDRGTPSTRVEAMLSTRRDTVLQPEEVVAALHLNPGQAVADIGSGPGYFTLRFARAVGPVGRVYGTDIERHFLAELEERAQLAGLPNVVPLLAPPDSPGLPPDSVDLAFFCSVYRHIPRRAEYLEQLRRCLKPRGRIAVLEWRKADAVRLAKPTDKKYGPPEDEKIDPQQVVRELQEAGFTISEQPEFLAYHFFVIAVL